MVKEASTGTALPDIEQRKRPVQERSRERVERILNVAARLITEKGSMR